VVERGGLPKELPALLKTLKNEQYATQQYFLSALNAFGEGELIIQYQSVILQHTKTSGRLNGESYVEFLKQLLAYYEGKIILIEDGAPYHGSKVVNEFKLANVARLTIERLPAFSPDYNPIEKLWKNIKRDSTRMKYFISHINQGMSKCAAVGTITKWVIPIKSNNVAIPITY
jgi:transposase